MILQMPTNLLISIPEIPVINNDEKEFIMLGYGYVISVAHCSSEEKSDYYLSSFLRRKFLWRGAGAYCLPSVKATGSTSEAAAGAGAPFPQEFFMLAKVDEAFATLNTRNIESGLEPISKDKVNCILLEGNLGQTGEIPSVDWLASNLLAIYRAYPTAKIFLYTGTNNFGIKCFNLAKTRIADILLEENPFVNADSLLARIAYFPKGDILTEVGKEAHTRQNPATPSFRSPTNSAPQSTPSGRGSSAVSLTSPTSGSVTSPPRIVRPSAGAGLNKLRSSILPKPKDNHEDESIAAGRRAFLLAAAEPVAAAPAVTPTNQGTKKAQQDRSPFREAFANLSVKTPDRRAADLEDTKPSVEVQAASNVTVVESPVSPPSESSAASSPAAPGENPAVSTQSSSSSASPEVAADNPSLPALDSSAISATTSGNNIAPQLALNCDMHSAAGAKSIEARPAETITAIGAEECGCFAWFVSPRARSARITHSVNPA